MRYILAFLVREEYFGWVLNALFIGLFFRGDNLIDLDESK
jgi:hypothetical protein